MKTTTDKLAFVKTPSVYFWVNGLSSTPGGLKRAFKWKWDPVGRWVGTKADRYWHRQVFLQVTQGDVNRKFKLVAARLLLCKNVKKKKKIYFLDSTAQLHPISQIPWLWVSQQNPPTRCLHMLHFYTFLWPYHGCKIPMCYSLHSSWCTFGYSFSKSSPCNLFASERAKRTLASLLCP